MDADMSPWKRRRRVNHGKCRLNALSWCLALAIFSSILLTEVSASIFTFGQKRFNLEGLINAGSLGLENADGQVAAFGDYNGDSAMDLFIVSSDTTRVNVYLWNHDSFSFQPSPASQITVPKGKSIVNIIPADFTYDGKLDLLVMMKGSNAAETEMMLWLGKVGGGFEASPMSIPSASSIQPFTLDANGDMHTDLMGYPANSPSKLSIWKNAYDRTNGSQAFTIENAPLEYNETVLAEPSCQLAKPHSSAFIDLDGDCLADLFLVCIDSATSQLTYQIWIANKLKEGSTIPTYKFGSGGTLPKGTGALSFADMDRDGTIDVVFPSCEGSQCFINIAYNKQMPLCSAKRSGWFGVGPEDGSKGADVQCRDPQSNLCVADPEFLFDFTISKDNNLFTRIAVADIVPESTLLLTDNLASSSIPLPLSLGDHNKDGYPDMAIITIPSSWHNDQTHLYILQSIACNQNGAAQPGCPSDSKKREGKRTFERIKGNTEAINSLNDVRSVTFFDLAEDGSLDLLLQRLPPPSSKFKDSRVISFIQNNFFYDAFLLKILTSNGACSSYCDSGKVRYKPWGVNYGGASYKFTVLDTNGIRRAQQVGQLAQTAYRALLTPYSYFGLGRTNNYVEALFIGTTKRRNVNFMEMEGVIPNSQVIVLPWEEDPIHGDSSTWKKELYLSPGDWIPWVMVVLATIIVILLGFVFILHLNEKREDERERKRAVHAINFDAL